MTSRQKLLLFVAIVAASGAAFGVGALSARAEPSRLEWRAELKDAPSGEVDLSLTIRKDRSVWSYGRNVPLADLQGLSVEALKGAAPQVVRFRVARDAGTFACEGSAQREQGSGVCDFEPGRAFAERLRSSGFGAADDGQLLSLAMSDVGGAYLDELKRQNYAKPDVDGLVGAAHHGVNLRYLREMDDAGYRLTDLAALSRLRDHGVDARYVAALKRAGYGNLSAEEVTRLRDHGVSADFIARMDDLGLRRLPAEDLVRLRDHGVSVSFVAELKELGYGDLSTDDIVRLRDHGVTAGFIRRANADGAALTTEELIRRRVSGAR